MKLNTWYENLLVAVARARAARVQETKSGFAGASHVETINGASFGLYQSRQSYNGADAVYTLHYLNGKKVSKSAFLEAAKSVFNDAADRG
jgi:hypothetical protein